MKRVTYKQGNLTVTLRGPQTVVDEAQVTINVHHHGEHQVEKRRRTVAKIGGHGFEADRAGRGAREIRWESAEPHPRCKITVFGGEGEL